MTTLRDKFYNFKARQLQTKVKVELTFDQWLDWWESTGHFHERGSGPGKWVMHRINPKDSYNINNIECVPYETIGREFGERAKQRWMNYRLMKAQNNSNQHPQPNQKV